MTKPSAEIAVFQALNEIGIINQLATAKLEQSLPDGLKASQFAVLNHLARLGGQWSPLRLANAMQVTKGAITNTVTRLEKRGLVLVEDDPNDGRKNSSASQSKADRPARPASQTLGHSLVRFYQKSRVKSSLKPCPS